MAIGVLFSGKCNNNGSSGSGNPPTGSKVVEFNFPRPEEQTIYPLSNIDFINGPCNDIFAPSTWTVTVRFFYMDQNANLVQYGSDQTVSNYTIPTTGSIIVPNVNVPTDGEYFVRFIFTMNSCSLCCSFAYLQNQASINEGCEATLATQGIEQGKPQFVYGLIAQMGDIYTTSYPADQVSFFDFDCYCDCF